MGFRIIANAHESRLLVWAQNAYNKFTVRQMTMHCVLCIFIAETHVECPWLRHPPSGCVLPCTILMADRLGHYPLNRFIIKSFCPTLFDSQSMLHSVPVSGNGFRQLWHPPPEENAQQHDVSRWWRWLSIRLASLLPVTWLNDGMLRN